LVSNFLTQGGTEILTKELKIPATIKAETRKPKYDIEFSLPARESETQETWKKLLLDSFLTSFNDVNSALEKVDQILPDIGREFLDVKDYVVQDLGNIDAKIRALTNTIGQQLPR